MKNDFQLPEELRELYRHWNHYIERTETDLLGSAVAGSVDTDRVGEVKEFAQRRMGAWVNRQNGVYPTSDDWVIARFKFCNIYRELDRQTIYFHTKLNEYRNDFSLWLLNMFACRFIANIETVDKVGLLEVGIENKAYFNRLKNCDRPRFGSAYVFPVSTIMSSAWPTREEFLSLYVPNVIEGVAEVVSRARGRTVNQLLEELLPVFGFNHRFLWAEVLIDVKYQYPELVDLTRDFYVGPGAKPSLEYVRGRQGAGLGTVLDFLGESFKYLDGVNLRVGKRRIPLSAENWEGICCEFRKYKNLSQGKGRRRTYVPPKV